MNAKDYQKALNIMAEWQHEEHTARASNFHKAARYSDYYTAGLMMIKLASDKPYVEIVRDVTLVYNKTYEVTHD